MMINYDGRRFHPVLDDSADPSRVAVYHQDGDLLWGEFHGGKAKRGALTGTVHADGSLTFAYCMVLDDGAVISGSCASTAHVLDDGRVRLEETWERYGTHRAGGVSVIEELPTEISARSERTGP
ncbi:MAG TPA: hypothetical protein VFW65_02185 [Pseudonocardiaceae bacterium]|nr:hypothetical protein [Pseudonocardiaceae bacterium]